jgi:hypothetical protein
MVAQKRAGADGRKSQSCSTTPCPQNRDDRIQPRGIQLRGPKLVGGWRRPRCSICANYSPRIHAGYGDRSGEPALPRHMAESEPARRRVRASRQSAGALRGPRYGAPHKNGSFFRRNQFVKVDGTRRRFIMACTKPPTIASRLRAAWRKMISRCDLYLGLMPVRPKRGWAGSMLWRSTPS